MTNSLAEIHDRMTARAFMTVNNPEQGPEVRRVLEELLAVLQDAFGPLLILAGQRGRQ